MTKPLGKLILALALPLALVACGEESAAPGSSGGGAGETSLAPAAGHAANISASEESEAGFALGGMRVGNPDAPVKIVEYASMTCPACANFHTRVLEPLKKGYIDSGQVHYEFRNYARDRMDLAVATLTRCQGPAQFFPLVDLFFGRQQQWMANYRDPQQMLDDIAAVARQAGMSRARVDQCLAERDLQEHVAEMTADGQKTWQISGTPTVILNGRKLGNEGLSYEGLVAEIEKAL